MNIKQFAIFGILLVSVINTSSCAMSPVSPKTFENQNREHPINKPSKKIPFKKILAIGAGTVTVVGVTLIVLTTIALRELAHGVASNNAHGW